MAKKDVIVLSCKRCGEDFLYDYIGSGRKPDYCESCRKHVDLELHKRYVDKKKQETKEEVVFEEELEQTDFSGRMTRVLTSLDSLRVEMCNLASDMNAYQSSYDKNDQLYLHKLEDINADNAQETQKLIKQWQQSRSNRRNVKNLIKVLGDVINAIPYKSYANALPVIKGKDYVER